MAVTRPGTECVLHINSWTDEKWPEPGDFLRTEAGSCYRILEFMPARFGSAHLGRWKVMRLDKDAVRDGQEGVFRWEFATRVKTVLPSRGKRRKGGT